MKIRFKKLVIATGALALLVFTGPTAQNHPLGAMTAYASELTQSARWVGTGERWQVSDNAGGYLKNCWFQDDITGHWYLLGAEDGSVMYAGLVTDQSTGKTYLLNTNHDGTYGRMITADGTYNINGRDVYMAFNQSHDGTFGAITTGLSEARASGVGEKQLENIPTDNAGGNPAQLEKPKSQVEGFYNSQGDWIPAEAAELQPGEYIVENGYLYRFDYEGDEITCEPFSGLFPGIGKNMGARKELLERIERAKAKGNHDYDFITKEILDTYDELQVEYLLSQLWY